MNYVMLDLETTGKAAGCPILSIGAVLFNLDGIKTKFYQKISLESCLNYGLVSDPDTMSWWGIQSSAALDKAFGGKIDLKQALHNFTAWLSIQDPYEKLWCCGTDFDFPILARAYNAVGLSAPWKYNAVRDYRTLRSLFPNIKPVKGNALKHSAIADATYQAEHLILILREIEKWQTK